MTLSPKMQIFGEMSYIRITRILKQTSILDIFMILLSIERIGFDLALRSRAATPRTNLTFELESISSELNFLFLFLSS